MDDLQLPGRVDDEQRPTRASPRRPRKRKSEKFGGRTPLVVAAALVVLFIALFVAPRLFGGGDETPAQTSASVTDAVPPTIVGPDGIAAVAARLGHPIYWAGSRAGTRTELQVTSNGNAYVRYLPPGVRAGDPRASFLIVATYPVANAYAEVKRLAGDRALAIPGGGLAFVSPTAQTSVYFAYRGAELEGEVYDPSPARARQVATSGVIRAVG